MSSFNGHGRRATKLSRAEQISLHSRVRAQDKYLYLKVFGERNTGSNYLEHLCEANFVVSRLRGDSGVLWELGTRLVGDLEPNRSIAFQQAIHDIEMQRMSRSDFGWKHSAPCVRVILAQPHAVQTVFLIVTKHPYSWARSLHRRPYSFHSMPAVFSDFIRGDFPVSYSDCLRANAAVNPISMLRAKALSYAELLQSGLCVRLIRYEDFLDDGQRELDALSPFLIRRNDVYVDIENDVKGSSRRREDYARDYALEEAGESLEPRDRDFIVEHLGEDVFELLGYRP